MTPWSSFITNPCLLILACQLLDHPLDRRRCGIDLAEIPCLPITTGIDNGKCVLLLGRINPDENFAIFPMVRTSCVEALLGPRDQPSCSLWHVGPGRLASVDRGPNV
jgi:hypothetical protein